MFSAKYIKPHALMQDCKSSPLNCLTHQTLRKTMGWLFSFIRLHRTKCLIYIEQGRHLISTYNPCMVIGGGQRLTSGCIRGAEGWNWKFMRWRRGDSDCFPEWANRLSSPTSATNQPAYVTSSSQPNSAFARNPRIYHALCSLCLFPKKYAF